MEQLAINVSILSQSDGPNGRVVLDSEKMTELFEATKIQQPIMHRIYDDEETLKNACSELGYKFCKVEPDKTDGFLKTSLNKKKAVVSLTDAIKKVKSGYGTNKGVRTNRVYYPCYKDINDKNTLCYVFLVRPNTDHEKIQILDSKYKSIDY